MGNNISNFTDIAAIGSYVSELGDVYYEKRQLLNPIFYTTIILTIYAN